MSDIFDMKLKDAPKPRDLPPGKYRATVVKFEKGKTPNTGTHYAKVLFKLLEPTGEQDMTGVNLKSVLVDKTYWMTEAAVDQFIRDAKRFNAPLEADDSVNDMLEKLVGAEAEVVTELEEDTKTEGKYYPRIKFVNKIR